MLSNLNSNNYRPAFGSELMLAKDHKLLPFSISELKKSFKKRVSEENMDTFVSNVQKFQGYLSKDGDAKYVVSLQPHNSKVQIIGSYGWTRTEKETFEKLDPINTLGERLINNFIKMKSDRKK